MLLDNQRYIYLDWNVIKYMKNPRQNKIELDSQFAKTVFALKRKYKFPYSNAHIKDISNHYSDAYKDKVEDDISFAQKINDNHCICINNNNEIFVMKYDMKTHFWKHISEQQSVLPPQIKNTIDYSFNVNMAELSENHPMFDFLKKHNGLISPNDMDTFFDELYNEIFQNNETYKRFRDFIPKINISTDFNQAYSNAETLALDSLLYHIGPFISSFKYDEDTLKKEWLDISRRFFTLRTDNPTQAFLLTNSYMLLDMHPLFKEKLKKNKNTLDNIVRDGNHCYFASNSKYYVSEDEHTRNKTSFLYKVFNIKTKVKSESEFLKQFPDILI